MKTTKLKKVDEIELRPLVPFNFRLTLWKPSHFVTNLEAHDQTKSWRTFRFDRCVVGVQLRMDGRDLRIIVFSNSYWDEQMRMRLVNRIENGYGLYDDMKSFDRMAKKDAVLRKSYRSLRGMRASCPESVFEIAIVSLLLQNTTIQRSTQMMRALLGRYGVTVAFDGLALQAFFSPRELACATEADLRQHCRLGYRAKYMTNYADYFSTRDDDGLRAKPREQLVAELMGIKGVGPYTAAVVSSHALRDMSAIPLDVWNRRIYSRRLLGQDDGDAKVIERLMRRRFGSKAGLAALYLTEDEYRNKPLLPLVGQRGKQS